MRVQSWRLASIPLKGFKWRVTLSDGCCVEWTRGKQDKMRGQWGGFRGLWFPISMLSLPVCSNQSSLFSCTLTGSRIGRSKPIWAQETWAELWESWFLALNKNTSRNQSLSWPGYERGITQNWLPLAAALQPVMSTGIKITLILVFKKKLTVWVVEQRSQKKVFNSFVEP